MEQRLHDEFPLLVRCESSDTVVFVACPRGGRFGDVRRTLAGLLQKPFATTHIAPMMSVPTEITSTAIITSTNEPSETRSGITPFSDAAEVTYDKETPVIKAQILSLNQNGIWEAVEGNNLFTQ